MTSFLVIKESQISNWTVSVRGNTEVDLRVHGVFDRASWILQLGVWESAGLWVESDAPKLSSVSVPGSVTSAPWETTKWISRLKKETQKKEAIL